MCVCPDGDNPLYPPPPAYNPTPDLNRNTDVPNVRWHIHNPQNSEGQTCIKGVKKVKIVCLCLSVPVCLHDSCRVPTVSEAVAREALLKFVESKWKYSSKPARTMTFKELKPITVYRVGAQSKHCPLVPQAVLRALPKSRLCALCLHRPQCLQIIIDISCL